MTRSSDILEHINSEIRSCMGCALGRDNCPTGGRKTFHVPGEGPADSDIMIIGEAPGAEEQHTGRPFVGRSGRLLTEIIETAGLDRSRMFVTSVLKCRPPKNRPPHKVEIAACMPNLLRQLNEIAPKVILTVGNVSLQALTGTKDGISTMRGRFHTLSLGGNSYVLRPLFHPAYLLRNPRRVPGSPWDLMLTDLVEVRKYTAEHAI